MRCAGKKTSAAFCSLLLLAAVPTLAHADDKTKEAKVKCAGVNECKGQGSCHSASNACKGQNGCKGQGMTEAKSEKDCTGKGGKVVAEK